MAKMDLETAMREEAKRQVGMSLREETIHFLKQLGKGNTARGIEIIVKVYKNDVQKMMKELEAKNAG